MIGNIMNTCASAQHAHTHRVLLSTYMLAHKHENISHSYHHEAGAAPEKMELLRVTRVHVQWDADATNMCMEKAPYFLQF